MKFNKCLYYLCLIACLVFSSVTSVDQTAGDPFSDMPQDIKSIAEKAEEREAAPVTPTPPTVQEKRTEKLVPFSFTDKPLLEIINFLAEQKAVNVVIPQGPNAIRPDQKVTFRPVNQELLPLSQAWNLLKMFLEISGYVLTYRENQYVIVRNDERVSKEVLPLYIVPPDKLPDTPDRIRYIYYFANLKISDPVIHNAAKEIAGQMLSLNALPQVDEKSNSIIISDRADLIKSAMRIISELDKSGFKETVEVIPLVYATASDVRKIFEDLKLASGVDPRSPQFLRSDPKADIATYFPAGTVIQSDPRTNSLIVMGREAAVMRIHDFVLEYIDIPPDSGDSILHVYDLQYLNSEDFAKTLSDIVTRQGIGGEQSRGAPAGLFGPERYFRDVIIKAETLVEIKKQEPALLTTPVIEKARGIAQSVYSGGNRLIIAALKDDWLRIKDIIEQLDKPQPIVILEVFICDLTALDTRTLAGDSRNPIPCGVDKKVDYIASMITPTNGVIPVNAQTLAVDLLQLTTASTTPPTNLLNVVPPGSLIISLNDPCTGIQGLLQILETKLNVKVITRPFVVTQNNQLATVTSSTIRRLLGEPYTGAGSVPTTPVVDVNATIQVQLVPHISSLDRLSLQIGVDIITFLTPTSNPNVAASGDRSTRYVGTNANLNSGQILVLGGLTQETVTDQVFKTPILGDIPIIGYLFKSKTAIRTTTNITVFISPTIVEPKLRGGLNAYTADKVRTGRQITSDDLLFDNFRDPVTRFFFGKRNQSEEMITEYLSRTNNAPDLEQLRTHRQRTGRPAYRPRPSAVPTLPTAPAVVIPNQAEQVKALLAHEDNPISRVKKRQG